MPKLDVGLDSKTNEHLLTLNFHFLIICDDFKDSMVEKVENVRVIKGSFLLQYHHGKNSTEKKSSYNYIEGM